MALMLAEIPSQPSRHGLRPPNILTTFWQKTMKHFKVRGSGASWDVVDPAGKIIRTFRHNYDAEQMAQRLTRLDRLKNRPCMCCGHTFSSEGPHNRLCVGCRKQTEGLI